MKPASLSSRSYCDVALLTGLSLTMSLQAGDIIKANNTDNLNLGSSWSGGNAPGTSDVGVWDSTVTGANTTLLGGALSWSGIRIANPGGTVTINAGDSLTLGSAGIDMSAATQNLTLGNAVTLGAAQAWNVGTGRTLTTTGALGGSAALTKSGAGTLTLSGANNATGAVTVSAGTLKGGAANALGPATPAAGTSITTGATLDLGGFAQTTGSLSGAGIVTSSVAGSSLTLGGDNATANFTGTLNSANITTVNKTGTGTQTLTGAGFWATANTTSQYNILDGTLTIDATGVASVANILPSGWAVSPGKTFNLNYNTGGSTLLFKTGALSGAGTVNLTGAGCIDFWSSGTSSSLNGFTGQLNIGSASLSIQTDTLAKATTTASVAISPGKFLDLRTQGFGCDKLTGTGIVACSHPSGGAIKTLTVGTANGSSQFDGPIKDSDSLMPGYAVGGGIALTKTGTGTLTLTGATTFTGATTINDGTLAVSNAAGWASNVSFGTSNSPKLQINTPLAADAWNFSKVISGANTNATFEKTGPGSVTLTAAQTYTGAAAVTAGALRLQSTVYPAAFPTIPGMKVWLDAGDIDGDGNYGNNPANGASVATWANKGTLASAGNFGEVQTGASPILTATNTAFNSKPTVTLSAAGKQLANTTNFTNTVSVVYIGRIGATKARLVSGNTQNWILGYWSGNMNSNYWGSANTGSAAADTNPHVWISGATAGANILGYRFDSAGEAALPTGTGSVAPTAGLMLGGGWSGAEKSDGDIAELFVFDHQLTTTERQQLEGYLYNKYLITGIPGPVSVANGATFGGFGSAGNIAVSGGGTLEGGNAGVGSLTAGNVTTAGAATLKGSLSTTAGSRALTVNNLAINGGDQSLLITPSGTGLTNGTYDLLVSANPITAPGATSVQATLKSASRTYTPVVDGTGTKIQVIYDSNASVYWTGAAGTAWNTSATNWKLSGNNLDTQFQANDVVFFNDSPVSSTVDISSGDVNPASTTFSNATTAYTLQGANGISTGALAKTGAATLTINNSNSYPGTTTVNGGTLKLGNASALGSTATGTVVNSGGVLDLNGQTIGTEGLTLNGTGISSGGALINSSATAASFSGAVAMASDTSVSATGNITLSAPLSGSFALTKIGAGTLTLAGANTHAGVATVNDGTLTFSGLALGSNNGNVGGNQLSTTGLNIASGATAVISMGSGSTTKFASSNGGLTISGVGTLKLSNGYWYLGNFSNSGNPSPTAGTTITQSAGGWIDVQSGAILTGDYANANWSGNNGSLNVAGSVDMRNNDLKVDALTGAGAIFDNGFTNTLTIGVAGTANNATYGVANNTATFSGTIGTGGVTVHVIKNGTGTQALSGSLSYSGNTTINNGILLINGTKSGSGAVTVNATGTLGGTGSVSGALTVNANGTLAPGTTGTGTLTTGAVTLTGTYACQLDGANCDKLASTGSLTLTNATLAVSTLSAPTAPSYLIATFTGATPTFTTVTGVPAGYVIDTNTAGQIKLSTPFNAWASSKGLTGANNGKHDNPDGDGFDNLMEYAFGTDPLVSSNAPIAWSGGTLTSPGSPTTSITNNGNMVDYRAVFGRRKDYLTAGLVYTVQFSADLSQWVNSSATPASVATGTEVDAVSVPYPLFIPTTRGMEKPTFFRVSVTENP